MDDQVKDELFEYFSPCEMNREKISRRLYWVCTKAYMTAGRPYGEGDEAMLRWVKHGQGTTVN